MTDIVITKVSGPTTICAVNSCGVICGTNSIPNGATVTIDNYCSIDFSLESPAQDMPIPESTDASNIIVKGEGNRLTINVSWTVRDLPSGSISSHVTAATVQAQIYYWINYFQPFSIENKYKISVDGIVRRGFIRSIKFNKSSSTPVTYQGSLEFIAGDVVAGE